MAGGRQARTWRQFAPQYAGILDHIVQSTAPFVIGDFPTHKDAVGMRADIYHWFSALRREDAKRGERLPKTDDETLCFNWTEASLAVRLTIEGNTLIARRRPFWTRVRQIVPNDPEQEKGKEIVTLLTPARSVLDYKKLVSEDQPTDWKRTDEPKQE